MAISVTAVGITQITTHALLVQCEVERGLDETEPVLKYDGTLDTPAAELFDPYQDFTLQGKGDLPVGLALATDGGLPTDHASITGGRTILTRVKDGESADAHNTWEVAGRHRENATAAA